MLGVVLAACGGGGGASGGSSPSGPSTPAPTPTPVLGPPNIVLILADDLGYGDLSSYGHTLIKTPNLDKLAAEGIRFTSFYVDAPVCAPSRAALMTGRWPPRTGIAWNPPLRLHPDEIVIAQVLKDRGYATGMLGKWNLGYEPGDMPIHYGFDYFYGIADGEDENKFVLGDQPTKDTVGPDMLAQRYTDYAIRWITSHKDGPFFLYLAHRSPHLLNAASPAFLGKSAYGLYGDTVEELDATVGDLLKALKDLGIDKNTLVLFTSDNGPVIPPKGPGSAGPLFGGKGSLQEGGIRVPGIAWWPARIRGGRVVAEPVTTLDVFPTLVSLARGTLPPNRRYDGEDISRLLTGDLDRLPGRGIDGGREMIFWYQNQPSALRSGRYKYLRAGWWYSDPALYDLEADPGETRNLSQDRPDLAKQLNQRIDEIVSGG